MRDRGMIMSRIASKTNPVRRLEIAAECCRVFLPVILIFVLVCGLAGAIAPEDLKYFKLVQPPGVQGEQVLFIKLDREIYKYSEDDFSDVRLFDSRNVDVRRIVKRMDETGEFLPVAEHEVMEDPENRATIISIRMDREPVTAFGIDADAGGVRRAVTVQKKVGDEFVEMAQGALPDVVREGGSAGDVLIAFPETRSMEYRLVIDNGDGGVPGINGVQYTGPEYRLFFQAREGESYQLFWGSPEIEPPGQDVSALQKSLVSDAPVKQARVGRGFANPSYGSPQGSMSPGGRGGSWFLFPVIAVTLAVLALVFGKLGRRAD
jgi:hypothetical protein